tara:strand:- start:388 stop:693 length:306 start_codon:yes stop_codon:yes gene_type:complete
MMNAMDFLEIGAHLPDAAPIETVRYLGPKSKAELNAIGVFTVGDLKSKGVIDAFLEIKAKGYPVSLNFVWAMFAGMLGVDFHKIPPEFKDAVKVQLDLPNR